MSVYGKYSWALTFEIFFYFPPLLRAAIRHDKARRNENFGIESGHCYSVTAVKEVDLVALGQKMYEGETLLRLVQIRNPWGKGTWGGPWSPNSELWTQYDRVADECGHSASAEDTFWMWEKDFFKVFNSLFIARIFKDPWTSTSMCGRWLKAKASLAVPVEG